MRRDKKNIRSKYNNCRNKETLHDDSIFSWDCKGERGQKKANLIKYKASNDT